MACRKNSPGKPCCDNPPCPPACDEFYTPSYYDATFTFNGITKTVRINKGTSFPCRYTGFICWGDPSEKLGDITIEIEPFYNIPEAADCFLGSVNTICDRTEDFSEYDFDTGNGQVTEIKRGRPSYSYAVTSGHYKHKIQRWGKRRYSVNISVYPIASGTSLRIKVTIVSAQAIRYSASCCGQSVYTIVTCPSCEDQTCVTTFEFSAPTGTVCDPSPHIKPACTIGSWIGYAAITLDEPVDPFGEVATDCSSVPPFPWNPALPVDCPGTPEYVTTVLTLVSVACINSQWVSANYNVSVNTGTVCYNDSISHYCPNGCNGFVYCTEQENTEYYQEVEYFSEPFECTDPCGPIAVYRETPEPEITGLPTENYPAGQTTDPDCVTYYGSMSQKRDYIAWPATFNVTICDE